MPANYSLPTTVPYTVISQVFLFNEDAGDEADETPEDPGSGGGGDDGGGGDPWIPDPDPGSGGYCYDEEGSAYVCGTSPRAYVRAIEKLPEDLYKKATRSLIAAGINLRELYNEAMHLAGREDEMLSHATNGRTLAFTPNGTIRVIDNVTGLSLPVKGVTVKTRRLFKIAEAVTDANGFFSISKSYRQKANVILKFQNPGMKIRGHVGKIWEFAQVLEKECGLFDQNQLSGINITLTYNANADTYGAIQWAAAHCLNTYHESKAYSLTNNIMQPYYGMNVWISSAFTSAAATPMLRAIIHQPVNLLDVINFVIAPSSEGIKPIVRKILTNWLPDVTLRLQNNSSTGPTRNADELSNTFFHEFGHSQHYQNVGNGYWTQEIMYTILNGGYGTKTTSGAGRAAVVESWGFFIGNTFNGLKYSASVNITDRERNQLENNIPVDNVSVQLWNTGSQGWIPFGLPHDLIDVGEPVSTGVVDNVSGYSIQGLFNGYQSGVTTVQGLRQEILNRNGSSQAAQVNALVTSYRY